MTGGHTAVLDGAVLEVLEYAFLIKNCLGLGAAARAGTAAHHGAPAGGGAAAAAVRTHLDMIQQHQQQQHPRAAAAAGDPPGGCPARLLLGCGEPGAGGWYSRRRVRFCLLGSPALWLPTWLVSYAVWLASGCKIFLPFVSDFGAAGAPTHWLFAVGMTAAALLWCPTFVDLYHATRPAVLSASPAVQRLHMVQPYLGIATAAGIIGVALNPEDERLNLHGVSANMAFFGGIGFNAIAVVIRRKTGRPVAAHAAAVACSALSFFLLSTLAGAGVLELAKTNTGHEAANATGLPPRMCREKLLACGEGWGGGSYRDRVAAATH